MVDGQLGPLLVDLHQVLDAHAQDQVGGLLLDAILFQSKAKAMIVMSL